MNRLSLPSTPMLRTAIVGVALVLSACGDDDGAADEPTTTTVDATATDASTPDDDGDNGAGEATADNDDADIDENDATDANETGDTADGDDAGDDDGDDAAGIAPSTTIDDNTITTITAPDPDQVIPSSTLPADVGLPPEDERGENEAGVPINLDETASLACANAEFARDAVAASDVDAAARFLEEAAGRAEPSAVDQIADLADGLRGITTLDEADAAVTEILAVCTALGHQI